MKNKKTKIIVAIIVSVLVIMGVVATLFATKVLCIHDWKPASCLTAETCVKCEKTQGDSMGHKVEKWNTTKEPTCTVAGEQRGTCTYCKVAVTQSIDKAPHIEGEWLVLKDVTINENTTVTPGKRGLVCSACGEIIKEDEFTIELTLGQKNALKTIHNYKDFLHCSYTYLIEKVLVDSEGFDKEDAKFAADHCGLDWDEQAILCAKEAVSDGESKKGVIRTLQMYGFTKEQIDKAVVEAGY